MDVNCGMNSTLFLLQHIAAHYLGVSYTQIPDDLPLFRGVFQTTCQKKKKNKPTKSFFIIVLSSNFQVSTY